ncbi:MAG: hypothetical protein HC908_13330 [Calothrix sp. SM1_7_51]|nr:hypothetical protein [Calothrix sp. SM1_7_51]
MYYIVEDGDTLPKIAEKIYGDRKRWTKIFSANPHLIVLLPGVEVFVPLSAQKNQLPKSPSQFPAKIKAG